MIGATVLNITEAWAAGNASGGAHHVDIFSLIFPLINFLIFLYIIKRLVIPLLRSHVRDRKIEILDAMESAAKEKANAETLVLDYRDRIAGLDDATRVIRDGLRTAGEREKENLLRETRELCDKLRADIQFLAQQEQKIAKQQLREEIARLAQDTAQQTIQANFKITDQDHLMDQFLQQIEANR